MNILHEHAQTIIDDTLKQVQPHAAVQRALEGRTFPGKCIVIAIGKAAWTMAKAASDSREKAKAVIMSGCVYVNGQKEDK